PESWLDPAAGQKRSHPAVDCHVRWLSARPRCRPVHRLLFDGRPTITVRRAEDLLDRFEHELLTAVATRTSYVVLHAGAVVYDDRAILLPGRSFSGKSTLVRALVEAGATYYSDDLAPLDTDGRLHAVPKRLALRCGARRLRSIDATRLRWRPGCPPRRVASVVLTRYRPGTAFEARRLSPGEGTLALWQHAVSAQAAPERAFQVVTQLAARVPVLVADRGEAQGIAAAILATSSMDR
ncbi:MAG: hypothetical protein AAF657_38525, partial [Acidobacteriota bacterium]